MRKIVLIVALMLFFSLRGYSQNAFVPDTATAIKVAEAIWLPIYGESIYKEKPFVAHLVGDSVWVVQGSIPNYNNKSDTSKSGSMRVMLTKGGVLNAEIRKSDCKVIRVFHSK